MEEEEFQNDITNAMGKAGINIHHGSTGAEWWIC